MENKFKKGLILGGLLAVGTAVGLAISKERKGLVEESKKELKTLAKLVKNSLSELEDISKEKYDKLVTDVVEEYTKTKQMARDSKKALVHALKERWYEMENEYGEEKNK